MRNGLHRLRMDPLVRLGQDLRAFATRLEREAGAGRAAHAERIPARKRLKHVIAFDKCHENLIRARRIVGAARGGRDHIGFGTIGDDRRRAVERDRLRQLASIGAALARTLPPFWPSVVEDASSNCSPAIRRSRSLCQALLPAWRITQAAAL